MKTINVKIQGISPLLQHRYVFKDELENKTQKKSGAKDYSEEWKKSIYYDKQFGIYQPAAHLEGAMVKSAVNFQITGKSKKTYRDLIRSSVFVTPEYIPHGLKGSPDELVKEGKIVIDKRLARINNSGIERLRPMLKNWALEFVIEVHDEQIHEDVIKQILDYAGRYIGIGDYRPKYGRFSIVRFG